MSDLQDPVTKDDHQTGSQDAQWELVEYGDYQCPYCGQANVVIERIQQQWPDAVRVVFRNFPLVEMHPQALYAAMVAEYAGQQGQFWEAHHLLFQHQKSLGPELYVQILQKLGLPLESFKEAMQNKQYIERIQADIDSGVRSGVQGTPSFFLNGQRLQIQSSYDEIYEILQEKLQAS